MSIKGKKILIIISALLVLVLIILYLWLKGVTNIQSSDVITSESDNSNSDNNSSIKSTEQLGNIEINNNSYLEKYPQIINTYNSLSVFDEEFEHNPFYENKDYTLNDYEKTYLTVRKELNEEKYFSITPRWDSLSFQNFKEDDNIPHHNLCSDHTDDSNLDAWISKDNYIDDEYILSDCLYDMAGIRVKTIDTKKIKDLGNNLFSEFNIANINDSFTDLLKCPFYYIYENNDVNLVKVYFNSGCGGTFQPYFEHAIVNIENDQNNIFVYEKYAYYDYNKIMVSSDASSKTLIDVNNNDAPGILDLIKTNYNDLKTIKLTFSSNGQFISSQKID